VPLLVQRCVAGGDGPAPFLRDLSQVRTWIKCYIRSRARSGFAMCALWKGEHTQS
jgi:hypothetical protein